MCETGSGSMGFLNEVLPFANKGEAPVYDHLKRAIQFSLGHKGAAGKGISLSAEFARTERKLAQKGIRKLTSG